MSNLFTIPEDGYLQLAPIGEFYNDQAGKMQVVDEAAVSRMCAEFAQRKAGPSFAGLLVDFDHFSEDLSKPSVAAGWLTDCQPRADGLYGQIRWTDKGRAAVEGGQYRFISPVWRGRDLPGERVRPEVLHSLALTNTPSLPLPPISNLIMNRAGGTYAPDAVAGMSPDVAFSNLKKLVARHRCTFGGTFESAWNTATRSNPALYNRARAASWMRNRSRPAFDRLLAQGRVVATLMNRVPGRPQGLGLSSSDLRSPGTITPRSDLLDADFWRQAEAMEPAVFDAEERAQWIGEMQKLGVPVLGRPTAVSNKVSEIIAASRRANPAWTFDDAWRYLKEAYPELWAVHVFQQGTKDQPH
jgi:hypothetical protein